MKRHVALLGDSSIDNAAYVGRAAPVVQQVKAALGEDWKVVQGAVDGNLTDHVLQQLDRCPDATHVVVSVGGNDALGHRSLLEERAGLVGAGLIRVHEAAEAFRATYEFMLERVLKRTPAVLVCTIYQPAFELELQQRAAVAGLVYFNDAILRTAIEAGVPVLDLRAICNEPGDLANPIEPSAQGGQKIARGIANVLKAHDFKAKRTVIYKQ